MRTLSVLGYRRARVCDTRRRSWPPICREGATLRAEFAQRPSALVTVWICIVEAWIEVKMGKGTKGPGRARERPRSKRRSPTSPERTEARHPA